MSFTNTRFRNLHLVFILFCLLTNFSKKINTQNLITTARGKTIQKYLNVRKSEWKLELDWSDE